MARTGTLLTASERDDFGRWLARRRELSGVSLSAIGRALDAASGSEAKQANSTQRVKRYEEGVMPTPPVLATYASAVGIPLAVALRRAGHFRELLMALDTLSKISQGKGKCKPYRGKFADAIRLALWAFPRRDVGKNLDVIEDDGRFYAIDAGLPDLELACGVVVGEGAPAMRWLHPALKCACASLTNPAVALATRRAIAAEYVNAWADEMAPRVAESERQAMRAEVASEHPPGLPLERLAWTLAQQSVPPVEVPV